ncbi:MAG: peptide chain release factor N(5)-glutamine methyltransferase [Myxococcota bacterium]
MGHNADEVWTVLRTLQWTTEYFRSKGMDSPRLDAELLLTHVLEIARIQLYVQYERPMVAEERAQYRDLVRRRGGGEPVAYILGEREFWSLTFEVCPGVLVPRPDTETLVQRALDIASELSPEGDPALRIAEVGTGTGCIAVSLAHERPDAQVWAGDVADIPLQLAPRNAARAGVAERVHVHRSDGLDLLHREAGGRPFELIVSNPPYLRDDEFAGLMTDVRDYEPRRALTAGADGLEVIRPLLVSAGRPGVLTKNGAVLIEIGSSEQAIAVESLMREQGLTAIETVLDFGNRARVVVGRSREG